MTLTDKKLRNRLTQTTMYIMLLLSLGACSKFSRLQRSTDVQKKFNGAMEYYQKKDYYRAALLFEEIIPVLRGSQQAEEAQYTLAYCYFYQKDYSLASFYFKRFYQTFGRSSKAEESMFMHAYALYKSSPETHLDQSDTKKAITAFQSYLNAYPNSSRTEECNRYIKELRRKLEVKAFNLANEYYKKDEYQAAIVALGNFIQEYPDSDYREEAFLKRIESAYLFAKNSILNKQPDRYRDAIQFYEEMAERYPNSNWLRKASRYYEKATEELRVAELALKKLEKPKTSPGEDKAQPSS